MELRNGKSIWDEMPEEWENRPRQVSHGYSSSAAKKGSRMTSSSSAPNKQMTASSGSKKQEKKKEYQTQRKEQKKIDKARYEKYEKKQTESRKNSSEHVKRAYQKEKKENRHDFIILGSIFAAVIIGIVIFVVIFTKTSSQRIYDLIDQGNYNIAYQEIGKWYEQEKNVDSLVYSFAEKCAENSEYKRAVAALEYLSEDAEKNKDFFDTLLGTMLSHGKTNRAYEVLAYMYEHGTVLSTYAVELYDKYAEQFQ